MIAYLEGKDTNVEVPDDIGQNDLKDIQDNFHSYINPQSQQAVDKPVDNSPRGTISEPAQPEQPKWQSNFYESHLKPIVDHAKITGRNLLEAFASPEGPSQELAQEALKTPEGRVFAGKALEEATFGLTRPLIEPVIGAEAKDHPVAATAGELTGGLGSLLATGGALRIAGLGEAAVAAGQAATKAIPEGEIGARLAASAVNWLPKSIMTGATFGTQTFVAKTIKMFQDGNVDLPTFGRDVLRSTAISATGGAALGAIGRVTNIPASVASAAGLGFVSAKMEGADNHEAGLSAAIWGAFELVGSHGKTPELIQDTIKSTGDSIGDYVAAKDPSLNPETARTVGRAFVDAEIQKHGGLDQMGKKEVALQTLEDINQKIRQGKVPAPIQTVQAQPQLEAPKAETPVAEEAPAEGGPLEPIATTPMDRAVQKGKEITGIVSDLVKGGMQNLPQAIEDIKNIILPEKLSTEQIRQKLEALGPEITKLPPEEIPRELQDLQTFQKHQIETGDLNKKMSDISGQMESFGLKPDEQKAVLDQYGLTKKDAFGQNLVGKNKLGLINEPVEKQVQSVYDSLAKKRGLEKGSVDPQTMTDARDIVNSVQSTFNQPKEVKFDKQGIPVRKPIDVVSTVETPEGRQVKITHKQVLNEAQGLLESAKETRNAPDAVAEFVRKNGGIKGFKGGMEAEEFEKVPVHMRGQVSADEMAQMAYDRDLIEEPNADLLRNHLASLEPKGPEPKIGEFYDAAQRNLEHAYTEGAVKPEIDVKREQGRMAALKILQGNKLDDQTVINLVDSIVADKEAFKVGYGQEFDPQTQRILGETTTFPAGNRLKTIINLANGATEFTGRHEAFHAVSNVLLDDAEKKIILEAYGNHEKAADAFARYQKGQVTEDSVIDRIFEKFKQFLERLKNYFTTKKFSTAEDIFEGVDKGEFSDRAPQPQYSAETGEIQPFKGTGDAIEFGMKNKGDAEIISKLKEKMEASRAKFEKAFKVDSKEAFKALGEQNLYREAIEAAEGKLTKEGYGDAPPIQYSAAMLEAELEHRAIDKFGLTDNFEKAGFVLNDGRMLDFTAGGKDRVMMHQDVADVYKGTGEVDDPYSLLQKFMGETGAVRLSQYEDGGMRHVSVEAHGPLSPDQLKQVGEYYDTHPMDVTTFEVMNNIGKVVRHKSVANPTSEDVARFFNGSSQYSMEEKKAVFFSQAEKTIDEKMPPKAPGDQILGLLKNSPGVKQEELDWIGLPEFLKGKSSVTKEEVQNFIKENNVQVKEVMKGQAKELTEAEKTERISLGLKGKLTPKEKMRYDELSGFQLPSTKFSKYTLPGGENYRELLLTLPEPQDPISAKDYAKHASLKLRDPNLSAAEKVEFDRLQDLVINRPRSRVQDSFKSSHFPEPNILAHIRFNDRVDAEGKKTLFLEELQSDWHQKGRTAGYKGGESPEAFPFQQYPEDPSAKVPNAPFKKTWHELALKRMLRYAVENGYDKLAWAPGEPQAERYDLSKQVRSVEWTENKNFGLKTLRIQPTDGNVIELGINKDGIASGVSGGRSGTQFDGKNVTEIIGKDIGNKINSEPRGELSGQGLKIGGEGQKGFYDQMLPSFLNKFTKKWGGHVGETRLSETATNSTWPIATEYAQGKKPVPSLDITPSMKESVMQGQPMYQMEQIKSVSEHLSDSAEEIRAVVNPSSAAPLAAAITREQLGIMARSYDMAEAALESAKDLFDKQTAEQNTDFIDKMEKGEKQATPEMEKIAKQLRVLMDEKRQEIRALGTGKLDSFIENYFPHIWDQGEKQVSKAVMKAAKRPFEGSKSFLKQRKIEFFKEGVKLGLTPVTFNPVDLVLLKMREMDKYLTAHRTLTAYKENGLAQFTKIGDKPPEGWIKIDDRISTVMRPITDAEGQLQGLGIVGSYYAQPDPARIINNYLSPGLQKSATYRAFRYLGNAINQFQLGFSAFHLGFTSADAIISKGALANYMLSQGHPIEAIKARIAQPFAPISNIIRGDKLLKAWRGEGKSPVDEILAQAMASGGGRARMDQFYATKAYDQMKKLFQSGKPIQGLLRVPLMIAEYSSKPILEYIVPRQKLGVFADIMNFELKMNPEMTHEEIRGIAQRAWDSVDNRMGQLVYDNLFWNRTLKDVLMASVRSVGWNLGTIREIGGGAGDTAKMAADLLRGKKPEFTYKMSYIIELALATGVMGAMYQYLRTGKGPQELKDYYFPKTGGIDANGNPNRVSLPTYMKDLYHYKEAPLQTVLNKMSPVLAMMGQMWENKDYYGTRIRNEDDPIVKQVGQEAMYLIKQLEPFGFRNMRNQQDSGNRSLVDVVQPWIGITPAPWDINMTKAEKLSHEMAMRHVPIGGRTQEQTDRSTLLRELSNEYQRQDPNASADLLKAYQEGKISSRQMKNVIAQSRMTPLQRTVSHLSYDEIKAVYDKANDDEKQQIYQIMKRKETSSKKGFVQQPDN